MITLTRKGDYALVETSSDTKILTLDKDTYAWVYAENIGEILVTSHHAASNDHLLAIGAYRLYDVKDEPGIADLAHLELAVGKDRWQGYLLLTGLPGDTKKRSRIIPTDELISPTYHD